MIVDLADLSLADIVNIVMQLGSLILLMFVFYSVLQIVKVVREEFADKQEQRFERWYKARIEHPRHDPPINEEMP